MRERLKEIINEMRELVDKAQASLDDRPVLQAAFEKLREKIDEAKAEKGSGCEA
jgi:regulator of replication initiation timing